MKSFIILIMGLALIFIASENKYWKQRANNAEAIISIVEEYNEDFVLDVLSETDEWQYYRNR